MPNDRMRDAEWHRFLSLNSFDKLGVLESAEWFVQNVPNLWLSKVKHDRATALRIAIAVVELVLPEWQRNHPGDTVPFRAVEAARKLLEGSDADLQKHAQVLSTACGAAKKRSLGYDHRIAEAARAVANAATASTDRAIAIAVGEAISKTEEHLLYQYSVAAIYGKETEVRRTLFSTMIETLKP